jgi:hypothetical protein
MPKLTSLPIIATQRGIFVDCMPPKLVTLCRVRSKPGTFRCSVCKIEFGGSGILKQFIDHLRKDHGSKSNPKRT